MYWEVKYYDNRRFMFAHKLCKTEKEADEHFLKVAPKLEKLGGVATIERKVYAEEKAYS